MRQSRRGLAISDLLALGAVLVLVVALGMPTLERVRELSKRAVCAANLKGIGNAAEVYADANKGRWMTPAFKEGAINQEGITYLCGGNSSQDAACVGYHHDTGVPAFETPTGEWAGSTIMSTTRAYWMLVRSGAVSVKQFVCPSSAQDVPDPTSTVDLYYDFQEYPNISYGYLVPFGPVETRPRQGRDHRMIFAADKGPFYLDNYQPDFNVAGPTGQRIRETDPPQFWRPFNSPNHGGLGTGEGQNALFADGRVEFHRIPAIGVDSDNIYTVMSDEWGFFPFGRIHGDPPHNTDGSPYPGQDAFGPCNNCFSTTDSLIYP